MNYVFKFILIYLTLNSLAFGEWSRVSPHTLRFEGKIQADTLENLLNISSEQDKTIIISSKGGRAQAGLALGSHIHEHRYDIVVDGQCASSCANYIFLAGKTKRIKSGWVGFHGNITAFLEQDWDYNALIDRGLSHEEVMAFHKQLMESSDREKKFLSKIGADQALFDISQLPDKGVGDGIERKLLIPSTDAFAQFGIRNVRGEQDVSSLIESQTLFRLYK